MFSPIGVRLMVMMFLQFFIWGAWYITVGSYMNSVGWGDFIGDAYSVGPIAAIISPFILGMIADRFFSAQRVLGVLHILGGVLIALAPVVASGESASSKTFIWGVLMGHMLCYMPTLGLVNTVAFKNMLNQEKEFPVIRVFGTLGWIAANYAALSLIDSFGLESQFYLTSASAILLGAYCFTLPDTPPPAKGQKVQVKDILCLDALSLMKERSFLIFMICSFLICIPLSAYYSYAGPFLDAMSISKGYMPLGQVSEVLFMALMPLFFGFLGVKWMLAVGMLAWVVRYGMFSMGFDPAGDNHVFWMILFGVILHGICYDFFFVTGQIYVDKRAPKAIRGQAQGFLVLMTLGLGLLIGAQASGWLVNDNKPEETVQLEKEVVALTSEITALETQIKALPEDQQTSSPLKTDLDTITATKNEKAARANSLIKWRTVWVWPTIMAGAVMLAFCALFKYKPAPEEQPDSGDDAG